MIHLWVNGSKYPSLLATVKASYDRCRPGASHACPRSGWWGWSGNLTATTDAHLAALAIEHQCELHSNDNDFARFPGLRWRNPW